MEDRVKIELKNGVADVRLVRSDKMNALDDAMFKALVDAGERLKEEKGVRAVVLSGEGRAFCAQKGMQIDDTNFAAFRAAMTPVYDEFRDKIGAELVGQVLKAVQG